MLASGGASPSIFLPYAYLINKARHVDMVSQGACPVIRVGVKPGEAVQKLGGSQAHLPRDRDAGGVGGMFKAP
ncbi:hypothetical protein ColKHC_02632 [Colletotrichum higginsianum]|nr:hypothetical protein ColKHC_02632 [Colletotrichum higginsianum]